MKNHLQAISSVAVQTILVVLVIFGIRNFTFDFENPTLSLWVAVGITALIVTLGWYRILRNAAFSTVIDLNIFLALILGSIFWFLEFIPLGFLLSFADHKFYQSRFRLSPATTRSSSLDRSDAVK